MKIYTRTGDKGKTSLFDGTRVSKDNIRVNTYGTVDELNSVLGIIVANLTARDVQKNIIEMIITIQHDLFEIGAILANPGGIVNVAITNSLRQRVTSFETFIDKMTEELPILANFILPGGGVTGSFIQYARAVSRRAERIIVTLSFQETVDNTIIIYFNRLSDLLFTIGRYVTFKEDVKEIVWEKLLG